MATILALAAAGTGAIGAQDGGGGSGVVQRGADHAGWGDDIYDWSLIVAKISNIGEPAPDSRWFPMTVKPLATLSGGFDPGRHAEVELPFYLVGSAELHAIRKMPAAGDLVMAVISKRQDGYNVTAAICTFMPESSPLVVIDGLDDPRVPETVERIQQARKGAATRPARHFSDVERLRAEFRTGEPVALAERLEIAATSTEPEALRLLVKESEPLEVHLLVAMNPHTPEEIVRLYTKGDAPEHASLRAAAEWNLDNRPPTTGPATRPGRHGDER